MEGRLNIRNDDIRRKDAIRCKKYAQENPDLIKQIASQYYDDNKIELNKNACIRYKKKCELKKETPSTEL